MKLGTVIPYLKKIQETYKSDDTLLLTFLLTSVFFHQKLATFLYQEIQAQIAF